eukprot:Opistho-2@10073
MPREESQTGKPAISIRASRGAETDRMSFYSTTYSTAYQGGTGGNFEPGTTRSTRTGYSTCLRPYVPYSRDLDHIDHATVDTRDNYISMTQREITDPTYAGKDAAARALPDTVHLVHSGFSRYVNITNPVYDKGPSHPPPPLERSVYGPDEPKEVDLANVSMGYLEGSGWVHNTNIDPVTNMDPLAVAPVDSDLNLRVGAKIHGTGYDHSRDLNTTHKVVFREPAVSTGAEPMPTLVSKEPHSNAYVKSEHYSPLKIPLSQKVYTEARDIPPRSLSRTKRSDPTEFLNLTHPNPNTSHTHDTYTTPKEIVPFDRIKDAVFGKQEVSGYVDNEETYIPSFASKDHAKRTSTEYGTRYADPADVRPKGRPMAKVDFQDDAFTRTTVLQKWNQVPDPKMTIHDAHPTVARTIQSRDPMYLDTTYDHKRLST